MLGSLRRAVARRSGVNLFGHVTGRLGLGVAARNTVASLRAMGAEVAVTDVDPGLGRQGHDLEHSSAGAREADGGLHPLNVFHLNPPEALGYLATNPKVARRDRINVVVPFWELSTVPDSWLTPLACMDVVLAPTSYIAETMSAAVPGIRCLPYPQAVFPPSITPDRALWGLDPRHHVFITSFDLASDISRKNPMGVLAAFEQAFPDRNDVRLVVKVQISPEAGLMDAFRPLVRQAAHDPRVSIITEDLTYREVLALYACSNAMVSLHRSEGLGLTIMEAMCLGVPVIATDFSGTTDYMTEENSYVIGYDLVAVQSQHPFYANMNGRTTWADARLEEAAAAMRSVVDDPDTAREKGTAGRRDMEARRQLVQNGTVWQDLWEILESDSEIWVNHAAKQRRLRRAIRTPFRLPTLGELRHRGAVRLKESFGLTAP